ncbi:MAG: APC family permease [Deltaproteobacteria bacterium]|nr:APC family permease [Deltaproteobacteria bacterium]
MSETATPTRTPPAHPSLGELPATAICGNDITSSCLYVSALAIVAAGWWAWVSLAIVAAVLFLFRKIYGEVVGALPLNGGAYNALLNTTSKGFASMAATLTLLSYMATAVISAIESMHYVHNLWHGWPVMIATVVLLAIFMVLTIIGIGESSMVAIAIFLFHMVTLTVLLVAGGYYVLTHGLGTFGENFARPVEGGLGKALVFGFAAAMLGISGFESSSNFVEEQAPGVFPKTLRNMWVAVTVFNPAMALLAVALIPIPEVAEHQEALLAHLGDVAAGGWLSVVISIDAALVLSGAVLTSFVGVTGLVKRMTLDRILPQFLLQTNRRGTTHRIVIAFFLLAVSVLYLTGGNLEALAGVYTISFLCVMALFAIGNILLKVRRARLPRPEKASWLAIMIALPAVIVGIAGNVIKHPDYFQMFLIYFIPTVIFVGVMLGRIGLLKAALFAVRGVSDAVGRVTGQWSSGIRAKIEEINSQQVVFFTRGDSRANLNEAMLYVRKNEHTNRLKVAHVVKKGEEPPEALAPDLKFLDEVYPDIQVDFVVVEGVFGPELIGELSEQWKIPRNFMFIGSPGDHFPFGLAELGGVRLII